MVGMGEGLLVTVLRKAVKVGLTEKVTFKLQPETKH